MKLARYFFISIFLLAFSTYTPAQKNDYPNELKGYHFFDNKKLKRLKPRISTMEDIKRIFGENCIFHCSYNRNWTISFSYFENIVVNDKKKIKSISNPTFSKNLYSITLRPKLNISFQKVIFSPVFRYKGKGSFSYNNNRSEKVLSFDAYADKYGLEYSIFDKSLSIKNSKSSYLKNGDLFSIEYSITDELKRKLFTEQK